MFFAPAVFFSCGKTAQSGVWRVAEVKNRQTNRNPGAFKKKKKTQANIRRSIMVQREP